MASDTRERIITCPDCGDSMQVLERRFTIRGQLTGDRWQQVRSECLGACAETVNVSMRQPVVRSFPDREVPDVEALHRAVSDLGGVLSVQIDDDGRHAGFSIKIPESAAESAEAAVEHLTQPRE